MEGGQERWVAEVRAGRDSKKFPRSFLWRCSSILARFRRPLAGHRGTKSNFLRRGTAREVVSGAPDRADQLAPNLRMATNKKGNVISWLVQRRDVGPRRERGRERERKSSPRRSGSLLIN